MVLLWMFEMEHSNLEIFIARQNWYIRQESAQSA